MKKIAIILASILTLSSCSSLTSNTNLKTKEGCKKVKEIMTEKFGGDTKIHRIVLGTQQDLNSSIDMIQANESGTKDKTTLYSYITAFDKLTKEDQHNFNQSGNGILIKDLPDNVIYENVQKVLPLVPKDMELKSVSSYTQDFDGSKPGEAEVTLQVTPIEGSTSLKGRKIETTFYEHTFIIDAAGKVSKKE